MKAVRLFYTFTAVLFLVSCQKDKQTESYPVEEIIAVQTINTETLPSQDKYIELFKLGIDKPPAKYLTVLDSVSADNITISAAILTPENSRIKYLLRVENSEAAEVFILEEQLSEDVEIVISKLDEQIAIGLCWRTGNSIKAAFYGFKDNKLHPYKLNNWARGEELLVSENVLTIPNADELTIHQWKEPVLFRIESSNEFLYSIIHAHYDYSSTNYGKNNYEIRVLPGSWELSEISRQSDNMLVYGWEPRPFDENVAHILEENVAAFIERPWAAELPDGYSVLKFATGDLDENETEDIAIVIEQMPGLWTGSRILYVLLGQEDGSFKIRWKDENISGREGGGVYGDPFEGVYIENGELTISHYGGSSDRWGYSYSYMVQGDDLILTKAEEINQSILSASGTRIVYYPESGIIEERTLTYEGGEFNNLLLFSDFTEPGQIFKFGDNGIRIWNLERQNGSYPPLPSLYRITFGEPMWDNVNICASDALDIVKNSLYPFLKKVTHPYSKEIIDNYNSILTYEIPDYSYVGENESLLYIGQSDLWSDGLCHRISVYDLSAKESKIIKVIDETSEIIVE